ncbi:MAG: hypothetical protein LBU69_00250, partial [Deltaproteobacteria bacterium]|nr:hypothetical protein [Deltaproteobacteria bacterium]
ASSPCETRRVATGQGHWLTDYSGLAETTRRQLTYARGLAATTRRQLTMAYGLAAKINTVANWESAHA